MDGTTPCRRTVRRAHRAPSRKVFKSNNSSGFVSSEAAASGAGSSKRKSHTMDVDGCATLSCCEPTHRCSAGGGEMSRMCREKRRLRSCAVVAASHKWRGL
jgi:hypothetical protein